MSSQCDALMNNVGSGVAAALRAVDCTSSEVSAAAFGRLFAPGGVLGPVLTILLALFIAFFAIALMLGRTNVSIRSLVPKMITLGLVMTFATSWFAYSTVVWNLFIATPDYLAGVLTGTTGSATTTFADKIDIVLLAVQQATENVGGDGKEISAFSPAGIVWLGAMLFLLGTVGVMVTARIALALLVALGPIFVVMALFTSTRGLFTGWLKGVVMLALTPLFAVLGGGVMLELSVPILSSLSKAPGQLDPRAAMAFFLIGAVHAALMVMVLKVAATMVGGWRVFGLVADKDAPARSEPAPAAPALAPQPAVLSTAQAAGLAPVGARRIDIAAITAGPAANDAGGAAGAISRRTTQVFATTSGGGQVQPLGAAGSRTRGIGNRFRPARPRLTEKLK